MCSYQDQMWTRYSIPRLQAPWTHGILVVFWQVSCSRSYRDRDQCRVVVWSKGSPPQPLMAQRVAPKACAKAVAGVSRPPVPIARPSVPAAPGPSPEQQFASLERALQGEGAIQQHAGEPFLPRIHYVDSASKLALRLDSITWDPGGHVTDKVIQQKASNVYIWWCLFRICKGTVSWD